MTIDELVESAGGLNGLCKLFGWQGGTIHQVVVEVKRRLDAAGIDEDFHSTTMEDGSERRELIKIMIIQQDKSELLDALMGDKK